ncbi:MAG: Ig-like domain-containing protein [Bryobacteraceae bacterium]
MNSSIIITFSEPLSTTGTSITVSAGYPETTIPGAWVVSGNVLTVTPAAPLPSGATITIFYIRIEDYAGNAWSADLTQFTTEGGVDLTPPTVTSVSPSDGSQNVGVGNWVVVTFSKAIDPSTLTNHVGVFKGTSFLSYFNYQRSADGRTLTFSGNSLPASTTVTLSLSKDVTDLSGNHLADFRSQFTTAPADTPQVVSQRPGSGSTGVPANSEITLILNHPINPSTVGAGIHVSQNGVLVTGTTQVTQNGQAIVFTPSAPFTLGALVQVFLANTVFTTIGTPISNYSSAFTVLRGPTAAPLLIGTSFSAQYNGLPSNTIIEVQYDQDLDVSTVTGQNVLLSRSGSAIAGALSLRNARIIRFAPTSALSAGTSYTLSLNSGLRSAAGVAVQQQNLFFFSAPGPLIGTSHVGLYGPPAGATGIGTNAIIRLSIANSLNPITANSSTIQVSANGSPVATSISFGSDGTISITPQSLLPASSSISVQVNGLQDQAGGSVTPFSFQFTTDSKIDTVAPIFLQYSVTDGAINVPVNTVISITANEPMDVATLSSHCTLGYPELPGDWSSSLDGTTLFFVPLNALPVGKNMGLNCHGPTDYSGNTASSINSVTFRTSFSPDVTPPQITATNPEAALTGVPLNTQIQILFNEPVSPASLSGISLTANGAPVSVTRIVSNANRIVTLATTSLLSANTNYSVTIAGVKDVAGNVLSPATNSFSTGTSIDTKPFSVTTFSPNNGSASVPTNVSGRLVFNSRVNPVPLLSGLALFKSVRAYIYSSQTIPATVTMAADRLSATLTPTGDLRPSEEYTIQWLDLTGLTGVGPASNSISFTTSTGPVNTPPTVVSVSPPPMSGDVAVNSKPSVLFSASINAGSLTNGFRVFQGATPVPGTLIWDQVVQRVTFIPTAPLATSTTYTIQASGYADLAGNVGVPLSTVFTTAGSSTPDTSSFKVQSFTPAANSISIPVNSVITLVFNKTVNPTSVRSDTVLVSVGSVRIGGSYSISGGIVTFTPDGPLPSNSTVTITATAGVWDLYARDCFLATSSFQTAASTDTTAPTVTSVTPMSGAADQPTNTPVVITFSKSLNPATINSNTFRLFSGATSLYTSPSFSPDAKTVTLGGYLTLPANSTITIVATHDVMDLAGNPLADFSSQFTTGAGASSDQPTVGAQQPVAGATNVPATSTISLTMTKPMAPATIAGTVHVTQNGVLIGGSTQLVGSQVIQFTPSAPFSAGALIQVFLDVTAYDLDGNAVIFYSGQFTVAGSSSAAPLTFESVSPESGAENVPRDSVIEVRFSHPIDTNTAGPDSLIVESNGQPIAGTISFRDERTLLFTPAEEFALAGAPYEIRVNSNIRDRRGNAAPGGSFSFRVGADRAETPSVVDREWRSGSLYVRFDHPIDPHSVNSGSISLVGADGKAVPSSLQFAEGNRLVILTPFTTVNWTPGVSVRIDGLESRSGVRLRPSTSGVERR